MPGLALGLNKLDSKKALIDVQDSRYNNRDWEIFFHQLIVEVKRAFDKFTIVVPVIPNIELAIERITLFFVFLFLECQKCLQIIKSNGSKSLLQVI